LFATCDNCLRDDAPGGSESIVYAVSQQPSRVMEQTITFALHVIAGSGLRGAGTLSFLSLALACANN